jgi:hypothetical protein
MEMQEFIGRAGDAVHETAVRAKAVAAAETSLLEARIAAARQAAADVGCGVPDADDLQASLRAWMAQVSASLVSANAAIGELKSLAAEFAALPGAPDPSAVARAQERLEALQAAVAEAARARSGASSAVALEEQLSSDVVLRYAGARRNRSAKPSRFNPFVVVDRYLLRKSGYETAVRSLAEHRASLAELDRWIAEASSEIARRESGLRRAASAAGRSRPSQGMLTRAASTASAALDAVRGLSEVRGGGFSELDDASVCLLSRETAAAAVALGMAGRASPISVPLHEEQELHMRHAETLLRDFEPIVKAAESTLGFLVSRLEFDLLAHSPESAFEFISA